MCLCFNGGEIGKSKRLVVLASCEAEEISNTVEAKNGTPLAIKRPIVSCDSVCASISTCARSKLEVISSKGFSSLLVRGLYVTPSCPALACACVYVFFCVCVFLVGSCFLPRVGLGFVTLEGTNRENAKILSRPPKYITYTTITAYSDSTAIAAARNVGSEILFMYEHQIQNCKFFFFF